MTYQLYPYQVEGVAAMRGKTAWGLFDDMGLGKTVQAVTELREALEGPGFKVLVIAPKSAASVWEDHVRAALPGTPIVTLDGPRKADIGGVHLGCSHR